MDGGSTGVRKLIFAVGGWLALTVAVCVSASALALTPQQIFAKDSPSIVVIVAYDASGKPIDLGSGVVIARGQVVTNCHVVKDGATLRVKHGDSQHPATIRYAEFARDLCQLSVPGLSAPAVDIGNAKTLQPGTSVVAIGAPEGLTLTISSGLVSALRSYGDGTAIIQTSAAISPGSSGGGLFDDHGLLVGITFAYLAKGQNLNFALPVSWITQLHDHPMAPQTATISGVQWFISAAALEAKNDWAGLAEHAQRWVRAQPQQSLAWLALGEAYTNLNQNTASIRALTQAIKLKPNNEPAWSLLGTAYSGLQQYAAAKSVEEQAIKLDPNDAFAWFNLASTYFSLHQYTNAESASEMAVKLSPANSWAWSNLAITYYDLHQFTDAKSAEEQAVKLDPKNAQSWYNLGIDYAVLGNRDGAIEAYQHLRKLDPAMADKLFNAAILPH